jgi:hypothetical protein
MDRFTRLYAISAMVFIALGIALAVALIVGIWTGFEDVIVGKSIGTLVVLLLLAGTIHVVAKGMCEEPKDRI